MKELEKLLERIDRRDPAKRDMQRVQDGLKSFEKKLFKKMMANPKTAKGELEIAINQFSKNAKKATANTAPLIQASIKKFKNLLKAIEKNGNVAPMKRVKEELEIVENALAAGTVQADIPTEGIPPVEPNSKFAGSPVFDCDGATFAKCINGKKKHGRWAAYLGKDNPFYSQMKSWMSQSYKNKNFVLRNKGTGEMVHARKILGEAKKNIQEMRLPNDFFGVISRKENLAFEKAVKKYFEIRSFSAAKRGNAQVTASKLRTFQIELTKDTGFRNDMLYTYSLKAWDTAKPASRGGPVSQKLLDGPNGEDLKEINTLVKRLSQQKEFK